MTYRQLEQYRAEGVPEHLVADVDRALAEYDRAAADLDLEGVAPWAMSEQDDALLQPQFEADLDAIALCKAAQPRYAS